LIFEVLRKILNLTRRKVKEIERKRTIHKWEKVGILDPGLASQTAHMLIVKDLRYIAISRICISSFLHFNPRYKVEIHCDSLVYEELIKEYRKSRFNPLIIISHDQNDFDTWQKQKLNLIVSLNGSSNILIDADLRWNSKLEQGKKITFLTREYEMSKRSPARQIVRQIEMTNKNPSMYNSSYFCFGGCKIADQQIDNLRKFHDSYENLLSRSDIGEEDVISFSRLSEQVALSLHASEWGFPLETLKLKDSLRDGGIVESTYFGATGDSF